MASALGDPLERHPNFSPRILSRPHITTCLQTPPPEPRQASSPESPAGCSPLPHAVPTPRTSLQTPTTRRPWPRPPGTECP